MIFYKEPKVQKPVNLKLVIIYVLGIPLAATIGIGAMIICICALNILISMM